jgi:hypothetical protein
MNQVHWQCKNLYQIQPIHLVSGHTMQIPLLASFHSRVVNDSELTNDATQAAGI